MNEWQREMMEAPSIESACCPFCGRPLAGQMNRHHIVPRSAGGTKGPTVTVCGGGNMTGCHADLHRHTLHLRFRDGMWEWLRTKEPMKWERAVLEDGWRKVVVV